MIKNCKFQSKPTTTPTQPHTTNKQTLQSTTTNKPYNQPLSLNSRPANTPNKLEAIAGNVLSSPSGSWSPSHLRSGRYILSSQLVRLCPSAKSPTPKPNTKMKISNTQ